MNSIEELTEKVEEQEKTIRRLIKFIVELDHKIDLHVYNVKHDLDIANDHNSISEWDECCKGSYKLCDYHELLEMLR